MFPHIPPSLSAFGKAESHTRGGGRVEASSCRRPFSSEWAVMSPDCESEHVLEGSWCEWTIAVFLGLLTDGKARRLHWAIFSCELVCRFSDAGPEVL